MSIRHGNLIGLIACGIVAIASPAYAGALLYDDGSNALTTARIAGSGPGQGVTVSSTVTIGSFAMDFYMPSGGIVKFMIWNSTNTSLLYNEIDTVAASSTLSYISTGPLNFTLIGGNTYYFGVVGSNPLDVAYDTGTAPSAPGFTPVEDFNTNYTSFSVPVLAGNGGANISLRLFGANSIVGVPEPMTLSLFGAGLVGAVAMRRRKKT